MMGDCAQQKKNSKISKNNFEKRPQNFILFYFFQKNAVFLKVFHIKEFLWSDMTRNDREGCLQFFCFISFQFWAVFLGLPGPKLMGCHKWLFLGTSLNFGTDFVTKTIMQHVSTCTSVECPGPLDSINLWNMGVVKKIVALSGCWTTFAKVGKSRILVGFLSVACP